MDTSEGRGFRVIAFSLVAVLALAGCDESFTNSDRPAKSSDGPVQAEVKGEPAASEDNGVAVRAVEIPARAGRRLAYYSNVLAFNVFGTATLAPFTPKQVWEYWVGDSSRAVAVVDLRTDSAIVILFEKSDQEKQTVLLDGEGTAAKGWLLRGQSAEPVKQEEVRQVLSGAAKSSGAFELKGEVVIEIEEGYVQCMFFTEVVTKANVPVDAEHLRRRIEFAQEEHDELMQQAEEKPDDELWSWGAKQAEKKLTDLKRMAETGPSLPALLTNGQIVAEWVREKPLIDLILP